MGVGRSELKSGGDGGKKEKEGEEERGRREDGGFSREGTKRKS